MTHTRWTQVVTSDTAGDVFSLRLPEGILYVYRGRTEQLVFVPNDHMKKENER